MPDVTRARQQLRSLLWRSSVAEEVEAELDFHVEMLVRELVHERGMDLAAARAEAERRFGGDLAAVKHVCRDAGAKRETAMRRTEYLAELAQDAAFAVRQLIKTPAFTVVAVLTLALAIGATTAIFSVVRGVVLRPFPFAHPERVTFLYERWKDRDGSVSDGNFWDWSQQSRSFAALGAMRYSSFTLADAESPERVSGAYVTSGLFPALGIRPLLGRALSPNEDEPGQDGVVVLSEAVGVYGVIAYFVGLRAHEIGVRMALGATASHILALMTWQGVRPVLAGVGIGTGAALGVTRLLRGSLHGVSAFDPATFALSVLVLVAVGGLASLLPARRATRVSPTRALQEA